MLTSGTHGPREKGYIYNTMVSSMKFSSKSNLSSNEKLKLFFPKPELLVIVGQQTTVNHKIEIVQIAHQWGKG